MKLLRWVAPEVVLKSGTASISGTGTLTATGVRVVSTTATLAGTGTLIATGVRVVSTTASLTGTATLTAIGTAVPGTVTPALARRAVPRPPQRPIPRVRRTRKRIKFTFTFTTTLHSQAILEEPVALRCTAQGRATHRSATPMRGIHYRGACRRTRLLTDARVTHRARTVDPQAQQALLLLAHLLTETPHV